ncbi:MAG: DUF3786 domain-containing protein [Nitrospirae bacterium]|nr:DUF3786 domain-containing protein [Nitrospirota bacterium]
MQSGEDKAWMSLRDAEPDIVCKNAGVEFVAATGRYSLKSFGMDFSIDPVEKMIESPAADSSILLGRLSYFFRLSVPWYLISARDVQPCGSLVKPENLTGGLNFFRGSHALPLGKVAAKYANDVKGFGEKGAYFGGTPVQYGDAAFVLMPFARIPVTVILWAADEEFEARVNLLLDATCELHAPIDIIWNISMMSLLLLL